MLRVLVIVLIVFFLVVTVDVMNVRMQWTEVWTARGREGVRQSDYLEAAREVGYEAWKGGGSR